MSTTLRFRDHEDFHRAALHMAGFGAAAGLCAYIAFGQLTSPWALPLVAAAAVLGAMAPQLRGRLPELSARAGLLALAAAVLVLGGHAGRPGEAVVGFAVLVGGALGWGLGGRRLLLAIGVGAAVALVARYVLVSMVTAEQLAGAPGWLVATAAGAAFSFVTVVGLLPRHVELARDPVGEAYRLLPAVDPEVAELCQRGYALWARSADSLAADDPSRQTLQEAVTRLLEVAGRWSAVDAEGAPALATSLTERMEALDQRIEATTDEVAREQYQEARAALAEQLRYIGDIATSRERVVARMHNYLAVMERLRLAVVNLQSTTASRAASDVAPLVSTLEEIGNDIAACSEALASDNLDG